MRRRIGFDWLERLSAHVILGVIVAALLVIGWHVADLAARGWP